MELLPQNSCCILGHSYIEAIKVQEVQVKVRETAIKLIKEKGVKNFLFGASVGFDMIAFHVVFKMKKYYPYIKICLILPYSNSAENLNENQKNSFIAVYDKADFIHYFTRGGYFDGCLQRRNWYMTLRSSYCICYMAKDNSGTGNSIRFARKRGLEIYNIFQEKEEISASF